MCSRRSEISPCECQSSSTSAPEPTATSTPEPTATSTPEPTATSTPEPTAANTTCNTCEGYSCQNNCTWGLCNGEPCWVDGPGFSRQDALNYCLEQCQTPSYQVRIAPWDSTTIEGTAYITSFKIYSSNKPGIEKDSIYQVPNTPTDNASILSAAKDLSEILCGSRVAGFCGTLGGNRPIICICGGVGFAKEIKAQSGTCCCDCGTNCEWTCQGGNWVQNSSCPCPDWNCAEPDKNSCVNEGEKLQTSCEPPPTLGEIYCIDYSEYDSSRQVLVSGPEYGECPIECRASSSSSSTEPTPTPTSTPVPPTPTATPTETPTPTPTPTATCLPCSTVSVTLTTSGCCLYLGPNGIEAVGNGTVRAEIDQGGSYCGAQTKINDEVRETIDVEDGDSIEVSLESSQECSCCEVRRNCNTKNAGFWVVKNSKEKGTTSLDRSQLDRRLKDLALKMASRRRKLRG